MIKEKSKYNEFVKEYLNRLIFIDAAKGLGIILVVLCHLLDYNSTLNAIIYSFHIPLFFIISGMFANPAQKLSVYLRKNIKRLLLPYLIVFIIGLIVTFLVPGLENPEISELIREFVFARPKEINVISIWFLACLFNTVILFYFLYKILIRKNLVINIIILGVLSIIAYYIPQLENRMNIYLPFKLDVSFMALVFYTIGFLMKDTFKSQKYFDGVLRKTVIILSSMAIVLCSACFVNGITNLSGGFYGSNLYMYLFAAFCGSVFVVALSTILVKIKILSKMLSYIGKNSLFIFSLHTLLILPYEYILDSAEINHTLLTSIIGTFVVLFFMILLCFSYNYMKMAIKKKRIAQ